MYFAAIRGKRALSACNRLTSIADGCADWLRCTMQFSQYYHLLGHGTTFEQKFAKTEFVSVAFLQFLFIPLLPVEKLKWKMGCDGDGECWGCVEIMQCNINMHPTKFIGELDMM